MPPDTSARAPQAPAPRARWWSTLPDHARPVHPRRPGGRRRRPRPRAGRPRGHPVRAVRPGGLPVRPARGAARPHRRRPGHRDAERQARRRLQQPDRHGRGRAGRRPGSGRASRRHGVRLDPRPLARHPRPAGLRPARHRQLGPAQLPGVRPRRHLDRRCRRGVRQPARAGARLLPHVGLGRRHRGAPRRVRLSEARPLRRLLRHQGRARLRRQVPGQRRVARARLRRAARGLRRPERLDLQDDAARAGRAVRRRRVQRHHHERRPRPLQPRAQGRAQADQREGQHAAAATASRCASTRTASSTSCSPAT